MVKTPVQKQPAKFGQRWAVDVLKDLEKKDLVVGGTSSAWSDVMEVDPYSSDGTPSSQSGTAVTSSSTISQGQASGTGDSQVDT